MEQEGADWRGVYQLGGWGYILPFFCVSPFVKSGLPSANKGTAAGNGNFQL